MEIKPSTFTTSPTSTADSVSKRAHTGVTKADPSKSTLQQFSSENIGYAGTGANKPLSGHIVTDAAASTAAPALTREEVARALNQVVANLAPFFVPCDESNASHIFVVNETGNAIELEENKLDSNFRDTHHEAAKVHFIANYEALYGKAVLDTFYPEELRKEPLTLGQAHLLREQLNAFQQSIEASCQEDPSKYDATLKAQLETLHQVEKAVDTAFQSEGPLKTEVASLEKYLSEQTGVSAETIHTCLLTGTAIAAVAATVSGLALPSALHAAVTAMLSHSGALSATAAVTTKATSLATATTTMPHHIPASHSVVLAWKQLGVGAATGTTIGAVGVELALLRSQNQNNMVETLVGAGCGAIAGFSIGVTATAVSPLLSAMVGASLYGLAGLTIGGMAGSGCFGERERASDAPARIRMSDLGFAGGAVVGVTIGAVAGGAVFYGIGGLCSAVAHLAYPHAAAFS